MAEYPKTLADLLGVENPHEPGIRPVPTDTPETGKDFALDLLGSKEYRESILRRIILDELPPALECKLWDYAYGRPVERVQVQDVTQDVDDETMDQLKSRVEYLFRLTHPIVNNQRMNEASTMSSDIVTPDEEDVEDPSIH